MPSKSSGIGYSSTPQNTSSLLTKEVHCRCQMRSRQRWHSSRRLRTLWRVALPLQQGVVKDLTSSRPITLAVLSALGDYSHSSKGVLVNVIDPTSNSGTSNNNSLTLPQIPETPPSGGGGNSLFGTFQTGEGNSNNNFNHGEASNNSPPPTSPLHIYTKLVTTFSQSYNSTLHSLP